MKFRIEPREGYLLAELQNRETAAEMRAFLEAVKAACLEHGRPAILMQVRDSRPAFKPEDYGLSGGFAEGLATPACRIALVGDSSELNHAHEYVALVARQQAFRVRAFRDSAAALRWLHSGEADAVPGASSDALEPARPPKLS